MEGLIPLVYRSLKKSRARRKYECLSSGAAETYNIADFYVKDDSYILDEVSGAHNGRHSSANHPIRRAAMEGGGGERKQLVKFRSHRMFSCVTAA